MFCDYKRQFVDLIYISYNTFTITIYPGLPGGSSSANMADNGLIRKIENCHSGGDGTTKRRIISDVGLASGVFFMKLLLNKNRKSQ